MVLDLLPASRLVRDRQGDILESGAAEREAEVVHVLLGQVGLGEGGKEVEGYIVLDDVIPCERQETLGGDADLDDEERDGLGEFSALGGFPFRKVAEDVGQEVLLERFLQVLEPLHYPLEGLNHARDGVEDLASIGRGVMLGRGLEDIDGRPLVVEVGSTRLEETANEEDLKELLVVFKELEGGACREELVDEGRDGRRLWDECEMEEERVAEA